MKGTHHWRGRGRGSSRGHISTRQSAQPENYRDDVSSASGQESDSERSPGSVSGPSSGRRHRHRRVSPTLDPDSEYPDDPNPYPYNNKPGRVQGPSSEDNESQDVPSIRRNRHNFRKTARRIHEKGGFTPSESYQGPGSGRPDYPDQYQDQNQYPGRQFPNSNSQNLVPGQNLGPGQNQYQNQNLGQGPGQGQSQPLPIYPQQQQQQFGYGQSSEPYYQGRGRGIYYPPPQQQQQLGQVPPPQGRGPGYIPPPSGGFGRPGYGQELAAQQGQRQGCMKGRNKIALICCGVIAALFLLSTIGSIIGKYAGGNKNKTTTATAGARRNDTLTTTSTTRKRLVVPKSKGDKEHGSVLELYKLLVYYYFIISIFA